LFAYVVLNEVDYLQRVIERDLKDDVVMREESGIQVEGRILVINKWLRGLFNCLDCVVKARRESVPEV
jgi:hypothetical protein